MPLHLMLMKPIHYRPKHASAVAKSNRSDTVTKLKVVNCFSATVCHQRRAVLISCCEVQCIVGKTYRLSRYKSLLVIHHLHKSSNFLELSWVLVHLPVLDLNYSVIFCPKTSSHLHSCTLECNFSIKSTVI